MQLFLIFIIPALLHAAILHPRLRRIRNEEIKYSIHLNSAAEQEIR